MADEYIRREDAICLIKHYLDNPPKNHSQLFISGMEDAYYRMLSNLNNFHSADVVQVIRCKDCKFRENDDFCTGRGFPYQLVPDDGFCDKGEREE